MAPGCERSQQVVAGPGGCMQSRCGPCTGGVPRLLCPVSCAPCLRPRLTYSAFCVPHPAPRTPCPRLPSSALRAPVSRVLLPAASSPCSAPAPAPRAPHPRPAPRTRGPAPAAPHPAPVPPSPAPRARGPVSCVPRTVARVPRPAPPTHSGAGPSCFGSRRDEKKIGRFPTGTSRFCMHCSGARFTRACG